MNPDLKLTLDVAQLVMLGGLVWGLATMSAAVKELRLATIKLTKELELLTSNFGGVLTRVAVLEDRQRRG